MAQELDRNVICLCLFSVVLAGCTLHEAGAATLVEDGRPAATVVISKEALQVEAYAPKQLDVLSPDQKIHFAAHEFVDYVKKMSGAALPIVGDEQPVQGTLVLIGPSRITRARGIDIPDGLTPKLDEEGYLILVKDDLVVLAGNIRAKYYGTNYAVYELLNRLGVRWFMPTDYGEYVPSLRTIAIDDIEFRDQPDFILREWWLHATDEMYRQEWKWKLRNKMNPSRLYTPPNDGSLNKFLPDKKYLETHPEYFGFKPDGSLNPRMPNLTNPEVPALVAAKVKAYLEKQEEKTGQRPHSVGIAPSDGLPIDFRKETMALNPQFTEPAGREGVPSEVSTSNEWFRFMNKVTEILVKDYPDLIVTTNGYSNRHTPPLNLELHPNLCVMFACIWADTMHAFDAPKSWHNQVQGALIRRWCELSDKVYIYGYGYNMLVSALTPLPTVRKITRNLRLCKKWGVIGFMDETRNAYMEHGITTRYARARLMWDTETDVDRLLKDFFEHWYGKAARHSQAFWDALEDVIESTPLQGHEDRVLPYVYTRELIRVLEKHQAGAERAVENSRCKVHVLADRHILEHLKGYMVMRSAEFQADWREAVRQADRMQEQRIALNKINPFYHMLEQDKGRARYYSGVKYWRLKDRRAFYQRIADMTGGTTGNLVALCPRNVRFKTDPGDLGRFLGWNAPSYDHSDWQKIDTTVPFYLQGYMDKQGIYYRGLMWYVFEPSVPASNVGKPVRIFSPIVSTEAWVWVNGNYVGHRRYRQAYERPAELEFDVSAQIKPGRNVIAVRVSTSGSRTQQPEGFQGRLLLYRPGNKTKD